jgi:transcriptional regulator
MDRRDFLTGMALADMSAERTDAAEAEHAGSLYIPKQHQADFAQMQALMREFAFADLITSSGGIRVTHLPVLYEADGGKHGRLLAHVAKNNPQAQLLDGAHDALIVFHGPHAYISPNWYEAGRNSVPTWNFAVVHCSGRPKAVADDAQSAAFLDKLVAHFESYEGGWQLSKMPESYKKGMRQGIVAFEMPIDTIEGKFKLGLERSEQDRAGVLKGLAAAKPERTLRELTIETAARAK